MVVLASKLYVGGDARERTLDSLTSLVGNAVGDLDVTYDVGIRDDDFPSVTVDGPDAVAGRNLLREEWGSITGNFEAGETYVGTLEGWDDEGVVLDAGREVRIPTSELGLGRGSGWYSTSRSDSSGVTHRGWQRRSATDCTTGRVGPVAST